MMEKLEQLIDRFQNLSKITSTNKSSSYEVKITKTLYYGWYLDLGCYDIADWPRHLGSGPFPNILALIVHFERMIIEAEKAVNDEENN
jgi:hypothetical protein